MKIKETIAMYSYFIQKHREKGLLDNLNKKLSNTEMVESYDKIISKKFVTKIYHVTEVPRLLKQPLNILLLQTRGKSMLMDIYTYFCKESIDWTSPYMKKVKEAWEKQLKENPQRLNADRLNTTEDYETASKSRAASQSWNLIAQKTAEGSATVKEETAIICRYVKPITMQDIIQQEEQMIKDCRAFGIVLTPVKKDIQAVFRTLAPTALPDYQPVRAFMTILDENVSQFETYSSGKLDGEKMFMGMDIQTKILVFTDLLNTGGGALNIMLVASTGSGKSYYMKVQFPLLAGSGLNIVIWDRDGEYEDQSRKLGGQIINLGETGGKYFNSIPIDTTDKNGYQNSIQETVAFFDLLCDISKGMSANEKYLFNLAYTEMFNSCGVVQEDADTWSNSRELSFNILYKNILGIREIIPQDLMLEYENFLRKLFLYFDEDGLNKGLFDEELNISEILELKQDSQPLILCINMQTKTKNESDSNNLVDRMKSLTMTYVTDRIIANNKRLREETILIVEEVQRHLHNKRFITDVHDNVTGGRKKNVILFLITNAINNMIKSDDQMVRDIVDNMNTMIIGGVKDNARQLLEEAQGLENCDKELTKIYEMSEEDPTVENNWKNAFLIKTKKEISVVKISAPQSLSESDMFKTRDTSKTETL